MIECNCTTANYGCAAHGSNGVIDHLRREIARFREEFRQEVARITDMTCPECGIDLDAEHDAQAADNEGWGNEDCCATARALRERWALLAAGGTP